MAPPAPTHFARLWVRTALSGLYSDVRSLWFVLGFIVSAALSYAGKEYAEYRELFAHYRLWVPVAGPMAALILAASWRFVRAPYDLHKKLHESMQSERNQAALDFENLRQTIQQLSSDKAGLEDQLLDKTKHQEIADRLTEAHTVAVERLINKQPTSLEGAAVWLDEIRRWTDDILATMTRLGCSKQDIHRIDSVAQTDLKGGPHRLTFVEEPMARFRLRLYRLQGIARRHAKRAENAPGNSKRAS